MLDDFLHTGVIFDFEIIMKMSTRTAYKRVWSIYKNVKIITLKFYSKECLHFIYQ